MKVRLSGSARAYLQREAAYLKQYSPRAERGFLERLHEARRNLSRFPELGRSIENLPIPGTHRLVAGDYVLDYETRHDEVIIFEYPSRSATAARGHRLRLRLRSMNLKRPMGEKQ